MRLGFAVGVLLLLVLPARVRAQAAHEAGSILSYVQTRDDLSKQRQRQWRAAVKKQFGGAALKEESETNVEVTVAKEIISAAIFLEVSPKVGARAAWEGYRGALGYVPPPIATHYQILAMQGAKPRGRPIDLAFKFPDFYNDEIAPELVKYWEDALAQGKIPDFALAETEDALRETRIKMRPLLLDKLRLLARLAKERTVARGGRRASIDTDMKSVEEELRDAFQGVARRPEVLDPRKRPFDRLRMQLEDMGLKLSAEDRYLDPKGRAPPRRPVPKEAAPEEPRPPEAPKPRVLTPEQIRAIEEGRKQDPGPMLEEPTEAPPPIAPPPQPRPGDPSPDLAPLGEREFFDLLRSYSLRLDRTINPWLGTPYVWGGSRRGMGTDCSGFTRGVFDEGFAIQLPRVSRDQYRVGFSVPKAKLQPGDLVFFDMKDSGRISHVGVYTGKGRFAHASSTKGVTYAKLKKRYYRKAYRGARRVLAYPRVRR